MLTELFKGAISGFISTLPMTDVMEAGHRLLPSDERYPLPPRQIALKIAQKFGIKNDLDSTERDVLTLVSHLGYGAATGLVYGLLTQNGGANAKNGALFGLTVWAGSYLGWLPAAEILKPATEHPAGRNSVMIAAHLVWGAVLGKVMETMCDETNDLSK